MSILWTSDEIKAATGGRSTAAFSASGLSIDTRSLEKGDMFIALQDVRDGHDFVAKAFEKSASGALISRQESAVEKPAVIVPDVLSALEAMAAAARQRANVCTRIALTGSVGKTSLKEMLARILQKRGAAHWNVKSFNNHWGVPLTLARMPRETQNAVFEIGMNTPGEIAPRSLMVQPHIALITKIAAAHLEGLGSIEAIALEKSDIFAGLQAGGTAIIPFDDDKADYLKARAKFYQPDCHILTFGHKAGADARVSDIDMRGGQTHATIHLHGQTVSVMLNAVGEHWALNAAGALLAACPRPDAEIHAASEALSGYTPPPGRGGAEFINLPGGGKVTLIDDAYNANPESMRAALAAFAKRDHKGRRILVLGEMREIGETSARAHAGLANAVRGSGADRLFCTGEDMRALKAALQNARGISTEWFSEPKTLKEKLKKRLIDGDLLLLKGSNASGITQIAEALRSWGQKSSEDRSNAMTKTSQEVYNAV